MMESNPSAQDDPFKTGYWKNGLFGCFNNIGLCALTFFAPCVTFGRMAESMGDDCAFYGVLYIVPFLNCFLESQYRETIRERRGIMNSRTVDFVTILFCMPCALTQETMEIHDIQTEEARVGAIAGSASSTGIAIITSQPLHHEGIDNPGMDDPYLPPSQGTWENVVDMNRQ